jgi:quinol monooxygenase YgiN
MFARYVSVRGEPQKVDAAIDHIDGQVRAAVEASEGNRGFALLRDAEGGRILGASYWDSAASMRTSERRLADSRAAAAAALGEEISVERFEGQLLIDRETGSGMVITAWENQAAADAFWPTAERLRARASEEAGVSFGAPDNLTMIRGTVRLD